MKKKEEREKIKEELEEIDEKIRLKTNQVINSPIYKSLEDTQKELENKSREKRKEIKVLEAPIYKKYAYRITGENYGWGLSFHTKEIKSSIMQGIKKGLGITNVALINEYDLRNIVEQLIDKDLENVKKQTDKLHLEIKKTYTQTQECYKNKEKLKNKGLNVLEKQAQKVYDELNSQKVIKEEKKKKLRIKIKKHLPKFMDKIINEVNKQLILDGLKDDR